MFCRYCGKTIADDSDFCTYCGKSLNASNSLAEPAPKEKPKKTYHYTNLDFYMIALCYLALGIFLFFNIKMAPFYGGWKFLAYIVEAAIAIFLTWVVKEKLEGFAPSKIKICSIVLSVLVIISSISLRVIYESKVEAAEADMPKSGPIIVDISRKVEYSSYGGGVVYDPETSVEIDGASDITEITLGKPFTLEIECEGNNKRDNMSETLTLTASNFRNGIYTTTKMLYLGGIRTEVKITLERVCTFWDVIFY